MKYKAFYVIRPNQSLLTKVSQSQMNKDDLPKSFIKPCLWSKDLYDDRSIMPRHEFLKSQKREVKILFVLKLKRFYRDELSCVLGHDVPQDDSDFEKWWDLDFFDGCDECFEEIFRELENSMEADDYTKKEKELMSTLTLI